MGVAVSMVDDDQWRSTMSGILPARKAYTKWAQTFVSIMTSKTDMDVYRGRTHGLLFHVGPQYDFWKYFEVIGQGDKKGHIVGGPADGGSHTPGGASWRRQPVSEGKDYAWFKSEKDGILAKYNTVYRIHDYNEFITNGLAKKAIAGVMHNTHAHGSGPTDKEMCNFLTRRVGAGSWPVYAYYRGTLTLEHTLDCKRSANATIMV